MLSDDMYAYGFWGAVLLNILFFGIFLLSAFKPQNKRDWRTLGAFSAFLVALFSEMFGFPLTIYILTSALGSKYPVLDPFTHLNGHLWVALAGGSTIVYSILHPLSNILIFSGVIIIGIGWTGIHAGKGKLVTSGIYRVIRHPQYSGFVLSIIGFLVQWPTFITILMAPILLLMYTRLAKREELQMIEQFSDQYLDYKKTVPAFIPKRWLTKQELLEIREHFRKKIA